MKTTSHGDYLTQLTNLPLLFPVNVYLVREEDGLTLIDAGMGGMAPGILRAAESLGGPIRRVVLTHAHADHTGSLDALHAALPQAEVLMTERSARLLAGDRTLDEAERVGELRGGWKISATRPTRLIQPGERVGSLEVVAAPGHSPDHIALFDPRDRSLIAGDALQTRAGIAVSGTIRPLFPFPALATWHKPTALASARRLRALEPARLAVGHGAVLGEPLAAMDRAIATAERKLAGAVAHAG
ncbi:MAG TPA: MBL fold metallo-hydrolase [Thermomicrobiaceae bacterium]|nr:MBL fold metallo-hydrolase [Thermomicrobiaceae bacterium]